MIAQSALQVTRWLGLLFATLSLFLLTERLLGLGPGATVDDLAASYRALFHPLANVLEPVVRTVLRLNSNPLPAWWRDAAILYLMFGAAHFRHLTNEVTNIASSLIVRRTRTQSAPIGWAVVAIAWLCAIIWPLSFVLLPLIDFLIRVTTSPTRAFERVATFYGEILVQVAILAAGAILFLLIDAGFR